MLQDMREQVCAANKKLPEHGLVAFTWGNVSGFDRQSGLMVIKPSGVPYEELTPESMVILDLEGRVVEGSLNPSSDAPTHLVLYQHFPECGGVVHTHSRYATSFAQARKDIPVYGTTHADYFFGAVPCTRPLTREEVRTEYEKNTGNVIVETFFDKDPTAIPGVIVAGHGPFTWGKDANEAVYHAAVLEEVAFMAVQTQIITPDAHPVEGYVSEKHYYRKHGENAYYGQNK